MLKDQMKIRIVILISLILFGCNMNFLAQERVTTKCAALNSIGGKYKLISGASPLGEPKKVILDVFIKPKNFTKEYMTEFAKRINNDYCNLETIYVSIFDGKEAQLGWHYDYVTTGGKVDRRRGTYLLNRKIGEEGVEFSTKPGNPINEIRIELSKPK